MSPNLDRPFVQNARIYGGPFPDLYVTVDLVVGDSGRALLPFNVRTSYRAFTAQCKWDENLALPIKYRDLPPAAKVVFTVWDVHGPK
jgi:phosphatidylinositol 3-kinase